jgi:hypothetical protein
MANTFNNGGKAPSGIQQGEPGEDSHTYRKLMAKKPAAPIVGRQEVTQGPHANGKSSDAGKHRTDGGKPNGSLKAKPKPAGGTSRTESPMSTAKKLYPSAK